MLYLTLGLIILANSNFVTSKFKITPIPIYGDSEANGLDNNCLSTLTQADCKATDEIIVPNKTPFGCPACSSDGIKLKDPCSSGDICQFGLGCIDGICDFDRTTCAYTYHLKHLDDDEAKIDPSKLPTCEVDGTFAPVQCKGDRITGRCFCYSSDGKRINGWAWWYEVTKENQMKCSCSRLKYNLRKEGLHGNTIHCDKMGNFEPLQCNDNICWCADKYTGEILNQTRAVPQNQWTFLPCYNEKLYGENYLRQCESIAQSQMILKQSLIAHGTTNVEYNNIVCDDDGGYGPVKNQGGKIYCQWKDGKNIGSFAAESNAIVNMHCLCALDTKIFELAGLTHRLTCSGLGNYEPNQNINGKSFCVDLDGFAVNEAILTTEKMDCEKYTYYLAKIKDKEYENPYDYPFGDDNDKNYYEDEFYNN